MKEGKVKVEFGSLCIKMTRYLTAAIKKETLLVAKQNALNFSTQYRRDINVLEVNNTLTRIRKSMFFSKKCELLQVEERRAQPTSDKKKKKRP